MISKLRIKYLRSLQLKKYRTEHKSFVIENKKLILELLENQPETIEQVFVTSEIADSHQDLLNRTSFDLIDPRDLKSISQLASPSGLIAICRYCHEELVDFDPATTRKILFLDEIQDPGNLGAMMRLADWFGADLVVCSDDCVDPYNIKSAHSSMGSLFRIPWTVCSLEDMQEWSDAPIYLADMVGVDYRALSPDQFILVIGNEGRGIRASSRTISAKTVSIPRSHASKAESLNAAMSAGVILSRWC